MRRTKKLQKCKNIPPREAFSQNSEKKLKGCATEIYAKTKCSCNDLFFSALQVGEKRSDVV